MSNFKEAVSREGVLHGIDWQRYDPSAAYAGICSELHVGILNEFQIQLTEDPVDDGKYHMQLWEMTTVPQSVDGAMLLSPQYVVLMPNTIVEADDLDAAKCAAILKVLEYIETEHNAAMDRCDHMLRTFGDLGAKLSEKTAAYRGSDPIETLGLSDRAAKYLRQAGIKIIGELVTRTVKEIKDLEGIGNDSLSNILTCLHRANMRLAGETNESITARDIAMAKAAKDAAKAEREAQDQGSAAAAAGTETTEPETDAEA